MENFYLLGYVKLLNGITNNRNVLPCIRVIICIYHYWFCNRVIADVLAVCQQRSRRQLSTMRRRGGRRQNYAALRKTAACHLACLPAADLHILKVILNVCLQEIFKTFSKCMKCLFSNRRNAKL